MSTYLDWGDGWFQLQNIIRRLCLLTLARGGGLFLLAFEVPFDY